MFMILGIFVMVGLIRYQLYMDKPFHCAVAYTIFALMRMAFALMMPQVEVMEIILSALVRSAGSFLYFWGLSRLTGIFWWLLMVPGVILLA